MPETFSKALLSTAYFPPVTYMAVLAQSDTAIIEAKENFQKQTYRNRAKILTANGPQNIVVPVIKGRSAKKTSITRLEIDNSVNWQENHLRTLRSAYASSPFFDFYFPYIEEVLNKKHQYLFDLNMEILKLLVRLVNINTTIELSNDFAEPGCCKEDWRFVISPKNKNEPVNQRPYIQVFEEKYGFTPGLSVIDLIFNLGNEAGIYLKNLTL